MSIEKILDKVQKDEEELSEVYGVPESSIVWIGDNHYMVVKYGESIRI